MDIRDIASLVALWLVGSVSFWQWRVNREYMRLLSEAADARDADAKLLRAAIDRVDISWPEGDRPMSLFEAVALFFQIDARHAAPALCLRLGFNPYLATSRSRRTNQSEEVPE